eukprot:jgi/Mesen1/4234/ME000022S03522
MQARIVSPFLRHCQKASLTPLKLSHTGMSSIKSFRTETDAASPLLACSIYVSEGRDAATLDELERVAHASSSARLVNVFRDEPYNRTGYTLAGSSGPLQSAVVAMSLKAIAAIDMSKQEGSHPRLGSVDHICFFPLRGADLAGAGEAARRAAESIGSSGRVPVFVYGHASPARASLADIRRRLGYFHTPKGGIWQGSPALPLAMLAADAAAPDFGPGQADTRSGCAAVGATPWVLNYNVPLVTADARLARRIARQVSERGGGLEGVQAMALAHGGTGGGFEIACNILDPERVLPALVSERIADLCDAEEGVVAVQPGYFPGLSKEEVLARACL